MNTTTATVAERVAAGARLLDDREPGWRGRIDLDRLEMADVHRCVLGQLYGSYERGRTRLLPRVLVADDQAAAHGFDTDWAGESKWDDLDAAWRALIEQRQTGGAR